jgi:hypothetical protein
VRRARPQVTGGFCDTFDDRGPMIRASRLRHGYGESLTQTDDERRNTEMTSNADHAGEASDEMLRAFLRAQRESVLAIVEGLSEEAWHRSVVPTGWTPAGMLEHLGGAEWHWFQGVVAGKQPELPGDADEGQPPYDPMSVVFTTDASPAEVLAFYRGQCAESESVLAATPLSAPPRGTHGRYEPPNVRWVVLHMIEETARHAGHLDLARELLDGKVRLGAR